MKPNTALWGLVLIFVCSCAAQPPYDSTPYTPSSLKTARTGAAAQDATTSQAAGRSVAAKQPTANQSGSNQSVTSQSESNQSGSMQPGSNQQVAALPSSNQPASAQPTVTNVADVEPAQELHESPNPMEVAPPARKPEPGAGIFLVKSSVYPEGAHDINIKLQRPMDVPVGWYCHRTYEKKDKGNWVHYCYRTKKVCDVRRLHLARSDRTRAVSECVSRVVAYCIRVGERDEETVWNVCGMTASDCRLHWRQFSRMHEKYRVFLPCTERE